MRELYRHSVSVAGVVAPDDGHYQAPGGVLEQHDALFRVFDADAGMAEIGAWPDPGATGRGLHRILLGVWSSGRHSNHYSTRSGLSCPLASGSVPHGHVGDSSLDVTRRHPVDTRERAVHAEPAAAGGDGRIARRVSPKGRWPKLQGSRANVNAVNPGTVGDKGGGTAVHGVEITLRRA